MKQSKFNEYFPFSFAIGATASIRILEVQQCKSCCTYNKEFGSGKVILLRYHFVMAGLTYGLQYFWVLCFSNHASLIKPLRTSFFPSSSLTIRLITNHTRWRHTDLSTEACCVIRWMFIILLSHCYSQRPCKVDFRIDAL